MSNDPYYDSRFLIDGTEQAEQVYNELIGRQKAAHGTIKSRIVSTPPGSPALFDAYLVATGGSGVWSGLDGNIVVFINNAWIVLIPKLGMTFLIEDEDMVVGVDASGVLVAWDGCQTITPDGSGNIVWDVALGATAYVVITLANNELKAPIGMKAGRVYTLFIEQGSSGLEVHFESGEWTDLNGGDLDTGILIGEIDHFGFIGPSCASAKPTQFSHTGAGSVPPTAANWVDLGDTPGTIVALQSVRGNAGATALEFFTPGDSDGAKINAQAAADLDKGNAVYFSNISEANLAQANGAVAKNVAGIVTVAADIGFTATVQTDGHVTLTTGEWDAVTGETGGLTPGKLYYLSPATAGNIEVAPASASSGEYVAPLGTALNTTVLKLDTEPTKLKV